MHNVNLARQTFLAVGLRETIISHTTTTNHNFLALMLIKLCLKFAIKRPSLARPLHSSAFHVKDSWRVKLTDDILTCQKKEGENFPKGWMEIFREKTVVETETRRQSHQKPIRADIKIHLMVNALAQGGKSELRSWLHRTTVIVIVGIKTRRAAD